MHKIIFLGTSDFAIPVLEKLARDKNFEIGLVVTQPDAPRGRKKNITPTAVKSAAEKLNLEIFTPKKIKDKEALKKICGLNADFLVLAAYGQILPSELLRCVKYGAVNIHPSLLPRYRGPSPVQFALLNGDDETGVTIIQMDEQIDHGPILAQKSIKINPDETTPELKERLAKIAADRLPEVLLKFSRGEIRLRPQDHMKATFTKTLHREDGYINWKKSAPEIYNLWRALQPWPGIYSEYRIENMEYRIKLSKIKSANLLTDSIKKYKVGEVFIYDKKLFVKCGEGAMELEKLQLEGKKEVGAYAFIHGHHEFIGQILT